jgi:hypothetical protein
MPLPPNVTLEGFLPVGILAMFDAGASGGSARERQWLPAIYAREWAKNTLLAICQASPCLSSTKKSV